MGSHWRSVMLTVVVASEWVARIRSGRAVVGLGNSGVGPLSNGDEADCHRQLFAPPFAVRVVIAVVWAGVGHSGCVHCVNDAEPTVAAALHGDLAGHGVNGCIELGWQVMGVEIDECLVDGGGGP